MYTQAYFENIRDQISRELISANTSIHIAVAWFTDNELFTQLCSKASDGITVELLLMDDEINHNSGIDFQSLVASHGKLWQIKTDGGTRLMHNKFCIIDNETIINGSYNWTKKAKHNHESITIIKESPDLALQFLDEFNKIKKSYFGIEPENLILDYNNLIIRLDNLKNAILLSDSEDINHQISKIRVAIKNVKDNNISVIPDILQSAIDRRFSYAVKSINEFSIKFRSLIVFIDEELTALKLETRSLELQISSLENEKAEIEKLIHDFEIAYNKDLGELISSILELRKEKLRKEAENDPSKKKEFEDAEKDFNDFNSNYQVIKNEKQFNLTESEKLELKQKYRQASKYCHPDVVAEKFKAEAGKVFIDLKNAYDRNDLETVNKILRNLEKNIFLSNSSDVSEKDVLKAILTNLKFKRSSLEKNVELLKTTDTYITVSSIVDWTDYFSSLQTKLIIEFKELKNE